MKESSDYCIPSLQNVDTLKVKRELDEVNKVLSCLKDKNFNDVKDLVRAGARQKESLWKRRMKVIWPNSKKT